MRLFHGTGSLDKIIQTGLLLPPGLQGEISEENKLKASILSTGLDVLFPKQNYDIFNYAIHNKNKISNHMRKTFNTDTFNLDQLKNAPVANITKLIQDYALYFSEDMFTFRYILNLEIPDDMIQEKYYPMVVGKPVPIEHIRKVFVTDNLDLQPTKDLLKNNNLNLNVEFALLDDCYFGF